ncbi:UDP-N-acetylglucosamine 1-carboxyvinyltransferase [Oceanispirochaeta crateris]|uniref:UDP-N-acetylglucosamine 1-carboxyvinyltransferase n=1 Tax=Oceanispirochaeta crateris TaxID=2518645 RepID=A0A5C1QSU6_9SPIO|nr:UDP-N-acetylglucosamine 1-carboxyvinyltransferase [Oceanispirochaeta crateris]QEN09082.1 UDP-N-acetylglucosamine 1-carboxyvinyltransferase [Oceanispirochaeta crateris]
MHKYDIDGGFPIRGKIKASGNKNAALPCIAAVILTDEPVELDNIPDIEDVRVMVEILRHLGCSVEKTGNNSLRFQMNDIKNEVPESLATVVRASILFAGPLLARTGKVILPPPGGDVIGRRRLDTHFLALSALGGRVEVDGQFTITANKLKGVDIFLDEASVTATENAVMAAVLAEGKTVIQNAASEPHVQDLCRMLNGMGADITGIGSNILYINGVKKLGSVSYSIGADFMEVGSYIGLAAVTRGELEITHSNPENMRMCKIAFGKLGIHWNYENDTIYVPPNQTMRVSSDMGGMIPQIDDSPWPGFPPDLTSIITVVATQVEGTVLIHEKMFESRMFFVDKLISMGAGIILCDPHRAVVTGPRVLSGSDLVSPDVRAGMAMVIAALCAGGNSTIHNVYQIERGYESLVEKLVSLGAHIKRIQE